MFLEFVIKRVISCSFEYMINILGIIYFNNIVFDLIDDRCISEFRIKRTKVS